MPIDRTKEAQWGGGVREEGEEGTVIKGGPSINFRKQIVQQSTNGSREPNTWNKQIQLNMTSTCDQQGDILAIFLIQQKKTENCLQESSLSNVLSSSNYFSFLFLFNLLLPFL